MTFSFRAPVALVAALLLSITAGFAYPSQGMNNGLLFLVACIVICLSTFGLRSERGPSAVALMMPAFLVTAAIAVVSALCGYAGSSLGQGPGFDAAAFAVYLAVTVVFGFVSTCISVRGAVSDREVRSIGSVLPAAVIYAAVFVLGIAVVADR